MLAISHKLQAILLVSIGAIFGSNVRFIIYKKCEKFGFKKYHSLLINNTLASFILGLFITALKSISSYNISYQLVLFVSIGFLGGLSTFSTFSYDLFECFLRYKFFSALKLFVLSLSLGLIAITFASLILNQ